MGEDFYRERRENEHFSNFSSPLFTRIDHGKITGARLTGRAVAEIVKRAAKRVGIDPSVVAGRLLRVLGISESEFIARFTSLVRTDWRMTCTARKVLRTAETQRVA